MTEKRQALVLVDPLKDFMREKGKLFCGPTAVAIIPHLVKELTYARGRGDTIIWLQDWHDPDDVEFKLHPVHSVKDTWGSEIIEEVAPLGVPGEFVAKKRKYSGFHNTILEAVVQGKDIKKLRMVGVCTSLCVMDTVGGAANRGLEIEVVKNAVADFDPAAHEFALTRMKNFYGAKLV